jgi:acetyl esterase/lipase
MNKLLRPVIATIAILQTTTTVLGQPPDRPARRLPPGVTVERDLAYVKDGHERQKLDLYLPEKKSDAKLPLIIWVHGGGWQGGGKANCPAVRYVRDGYAVASVGYRLSGDAIFPAQIEDCKAAVRWLRAHADEYGIDRDRFAAWGSSAGGHLVALLGTSGGVKEFDVGENLDQSSAVQAVVDYYGPTDLVQFVKTPRYERHSSDDAPEAKLLGGPVLENLDKAAKANPITYVDAHDPPFLIVHGSADPTVPPNQSELLKDALEKAKVSVELKILPDARHGGPEFNSPEVVELVTKFFDEHLKSKRSS